MVLQLWRLINTSRLHNEFRGKGIQWRFMTELAPHTAGAHERLVRCTKQVLRAALKTAKLTPFQLETAVIQAEAIVNSRPLGNVSEEPSDALPVTPAMLLNGYSNDVDPYPADLQRLSLTGAKERWQSRIALQKKMMKNFVSFYIQELRTRQKWHHKKEDLKVNDLVLLEEQSKRTQWPIGKVVRAIKGRDQAVRTVEIRTKNGVYRRPVTKCVKLELDTE